ncbi:MAG: glycosyl transferase family 28 [Proteobacteria bacterium]|nr:glycosyl transferase family 28 [Pseudomonadota bacterium]
MSAHRVLFFVQHLRGIGHLKRTAVLARTVARDGIEVDIISGGAAVPDLDIGAAGFFQLPPVKSPDDSYSRLVDESGAPATPELRRRRRAQLLAHVVARRPDMVIVEMFPFGRSQIRDDIVALVEAARAMRPRPWLVSSVRDILPAKRTPERYEEMADDAEAYFDFIMVHGDKALVPFEASFPPAARLEGKLRYTGYVTGAEAGAAREGEKEGEGARKEEGEGDGEVVVSAGGGAFAKGLLETALAARGLSRLSSRTWRLITGPNFEDGDFRALEAAAPAGVVIERTRRDFPELLQRAAVSVSQCGYNTVMDILTSGARAVVVPYLNGRQTEQSLRAECLAARGVVRALSGDAITPDALARAIDAAAAGAPADAAGIDLDGAAKSARLIKGWLETGRRR